MIHAAALIFNFGINELLLHRNENTVLCSTGGTAAAMSGYGKTDCDYRVTVCVK